MPGLLIQSPAWVRAVFDHAWAARQALAQHVQDLPSALWGFLLGCPGGLVAITTDESHYVPGPVTIRHQPLQNVAFVSVQDLGQQNERPLHVIGHLIDHHLGCGGDAEGPWLSEGGGVAAGWREAGARLPALFALGYGLDEVARSSVRDYFAQSLAFYCRDRQRLNVADPQIDKWFRTILWNEAFWRAMARPKEE